jgi:hypothetical protein
MPDHETKMSAPNTEVEVLSGGSKLSAGRRRRHHMWGGDVKGGASPAAPAAPAELSAGRRRRRFRGGEAVTGGASPAAPAAPAAPAELSAGRRRRHHMWGGDVKGGASPAAPAATPAELSAGRRRRRMRGGAVEAAPADVQQVAVSGGAAPAADAVDLKAGRRCPRHSHRSRSTGYCVRNSGKHLEYRRLSRSKSPFRRRHRKSLFSGGDEAKTAAADASVFA